MTEHARDQRRGVVLEGAALFDEKRTPDHVIQDQAVVISLVSDVSNPKISGEQRDRAMKLLEARLDERFVLARITGAFAETFRQGSAERFIVDRVKLQFEGENILQQNLNFLETLPPSLARDKAIESNRTSIESSSAESKTTVGGILKLLRRIEE